MKKGFTLAEVLITLGIIGVVAALTLPTLTANTQNAKIGPKLAKAVSSFEQANEALLSAHSIDYLSDEYDNSKAADYSSVLTNYLKASVISGVIKGNDGVDYSVVFDKFTAPSSDTPPHKHQLGTVTIDINGADTKPNEKGTDVFVFLMYADGSLVPKGANGAWKGKCDIDKKPTDPEYCAGHIFENNLKVLYK